MGFVSQYGQYPSLAVATGAPFAVARYSGGDLEVGIASQTKTNLWLNDAANNNTLSGTLTVDGNVTNAGPTYFTGNMTANGSNTWAGPNYYTQPETNAAVLAVQGPLFANGSNTVGTTYGMGAQTNAGPIQASTFYGDGSHLTGLSGGAVTNQTVLTNAAAIPQIVGANGFTGSNGFGGVFTIAATAVVTNSAISNTVNGPIYLAANLVSAGASNGFNGPIVMAYLQGATNVTAPTCVTNAGAGGGTGTIMLDANASDSAGTITLLTGSAPVAGANILTLTWHNAHGGIGHTVFSPANSSIDASGYHLYGSNIAGGFILAEHPGNGLTAATTYQFNYISIW
jgi:hypothetical protein